ncbi:hypothetical protein [Egicoccus sp. AB-alg2]|uniref:hypothetical protein n=1 Tax=Egicoccus sp. AB-alg2 TaxID=3242693 RepID=UPI00359D5D18
MSAGDATQRIKQQAQDGVAKAQRQFEAAKERAEQTNERSQLPPAEDADQALRQVRDLRSALDRDLAALEARIPPRDTLVGQARAVGGAVLGVVGLVGAAATVQQKRKDKKKVEEEADKVARAIARHLPAAIAEVSPPIRPTVVETPGKKGRAGRTLAILALLASAGFAVWTQLRNRAQEPDIWGPPPAPTAGGDGPLPPPAPSGPPTAGPGTTPGTSTLADDTDGNLFGSRPPTT